MGLRENVSKSTENLSYYFYHYFTTLFILVHITRALGESQKFTDRNLKLCSDQVDVVLMVKDRQHGLIQIELWTLARAFIIRTVHCVRIPDSFNIEYL